MKERDPFSFGADARRLIDQPHAGVPTAVECGVEILDGETDVMDSGASGGDELADWGGRIRGFEQLDQRIPGGEPGDSGPVGIVQGDGREAEDISIEGQDRVEVADRDAYVGDGGAATCGFLHRVSGLAPGVNVH
jgi:hypothetical protein